MDDAIYGAAADADAQGPRRTGSPVSDQISLLRTAFAHG
jgi:hypothetical protein